LLAPAVALLGPVVVGSLVGGALVLLRALAPRRRAEPGLARRDASGRRPPPGIRLLPPPAAGGDPADLRVPLPPRGHGPRGDAPPRGPARLGVGRAEGGPARVVAVPAAPRR